MLFPLIKGCMAGGALIIAVGAQNAFILKMGISRHYPLLIALVCVLIDTVMIFLGVSGIGEMIQNNPLLLKVANWGGVAFLLYYGTRSLISACSPSTMAEERNTQRPPLTSVLMTLLAVTLLNPHLYLDTVILLGSIAAQLDQADRFYFALGATIASLIWFFSLSYGAALLAPLFRKPGTWRILDLLVGCMMFFIALTLVL